MDKLLNTKCANQPTPSLGTIPRNSVQVKGETHFEKKNWFPLEIISPKI